MDVMCVITWRSDKGEWTGARPIPLDAARSLFGREEAIIGSVGTDKYGLQWEICSETHEIKPEM